ncbi:hypothetical protein KM176_15070 [Pseudooceanicola sp. CBS1P-1]|uniref:Peptide ABC transporter substrate-binding protein n=1 Tax=Pseudooceanicola albus TaxID=2692189 RepID=A0A6L7G4S0_9RHOB|nr:MULTISPECIES: ABC transporter substrate-binding protein [Pseudooceanicola]MBT9385191.1 hypothetical protein [Pseudooceanicola endophyticus]MXN18517.1 peptide ABC transporter substrate-binding protein [Pseudooceanicola albus]
MKVRLLGYGAALALGAVLGSPAFAFEGTSVSAPSCDYGGTIKSIAATDELTVTVTMCKPDPAFSAKIIFPVFGIQPSEHIAALGPEGKLLDDPIGTGPFKLDAWNRGDSIVMSRNDNYWGKEPAYDKLVFRWNASGAGRLNELRAGTVDEITNLSPDDFDAVENDPSLQFLPVASPNSFYLGMNNTYKPFDDVRVRQAIGMGIDRQRIIDYYYPEGSEVASHFTPCSLENGCAGDDWYAFDPKKAKELLAEAGYPDGFKTKIFYRDVFRSYLPEPGSVAVEIQTQLKQNLGIDAEVVPMESGEFIDAAAQGRLDGFHLLGWGADYPHVTNFLDYHFSSNTKNFGKPQPAIYEPLAKAATIADPAKAEPLYAEANDEIKKLVPTVPIAHGASAYAAQANLTGGEVPAFGAIRFEDVNPGKDTFVFMQNAEPISLYCPDESDGESLAACTPITETLLRYDPKTKKIGPNLATSCDANEDSTVWTCHLREGVKFTDGSAFDANDVVASWGAGIDAANPAHVGNTGAFTYYAYLFGSLMNAK